MFLIASCDDNSARNLQVNHTELAMLAAIVINIIIIIIIGIVVNHIISSPSADVTNPYHSNVSDKVQDSFGEFVFFNRSFPAHSNPRGGCYWS